MLYNLFENRDFVSVFAVALLAEGVDRNRLHYICTMEDETGEIIDNTNMCVCEGKPNE